MTRFSDIEAYWTGKGWAEQAPVRRRSGQLPDHPWRSSAIEQHYARHGARVEITGLNEPSAELHETLSADPRVVASRRASTATYSLMNRAAADPPLVELIGATLLMIATALLLLWSAGRIFRMAMLRSGSRPKFAEVMQWIRGRGDA